MQKCFVVLEPASHMYKVIEAAAARGLHVVVFHTLDLRAEGAYRPGLEAIAEIHRFDGWEDEDEALRRVLALIGEREVVGSYAAYESLLLLDAALRERVGLPTHGRDTLAHLLDKRWVRTRLREAGLSELADFDPRAVLIDERWPLPDRAAYLKPVTGSGSVHVSRCASVADVVAGLADWDNQSIGCRPIQKQHLMRAGELFLEEEAAGELMSLEGWVYDGVYTPLGLTSRTLLRRDVAVEMGATFPYEHPRRTEIEAKIGAIHRALGLRHGATHAELIVTADGRIELVELNLRFAGSDLLLLIDMTREQSVGELLTDLACGRLPGEFGAQGRGYASVQQLLARAGTTSIDAIELPAGLVVESRMLKPLGSAIASTDFQQDHIAAFIVRDHSYEAVLDKARDVRRQARINGELLGEDRNNAVLLR